LVIYAPRDKDFVTTYELKTGRKEKLPGARLTYYDLGEDLRLVLLSVTEGEDRPLKYPTIFNSSDVAIVTRQIWLKRSNLTGPQPIATSRPCVRVGRSSGSRPRLRKDWKNILRSSRHGPPNCDQRWPPKEAITCYGQKHPFDVAILQPVLIRIRVKADCSIPPPRGNWEFNQMVL
jgi:hypothetical protein